MLLAGVEESGARARDLAAAGQLVESIYIAEAILRLQPDHVEAAAVHGDGPRSIAECGRRHKFLGVGLVAQPNK